VTDRPTAAIFALILTCFTAYLSFRGIAWVLTNGWRSMLGLSVETMSCGCPYGSAEYGCLTCGHTRCPRHRDMPHVCSNAWAGLDAALAEAGAAHDQDFRQWESEFGERAQ
jgi:hypothetical protein